MGAYPEVAATLQDAIRSYQSASMTLEALQAQIDVAKAQIVEVSEVRTRSFLHEVEARLELLAFSTEPERLFGESLPIVNELSVWLDLYLSEGDFDGRAFNLRWPPI